MPGLSLLDALTIAGEAASARRGVVIAAVVEDFTGLELTPGSRIVVTEDGTVAGRLHPLVDQVVREWALHQLGEKRSRLLGFAGSADHLERVRDGPQSLRVYFEVVPRQPWLVIVGAGHIAVPLARIASLLDFKVTVIDDRQEMASHERFPDASELLVGPYRELVRSLSVDPDAYLVLVTRGHVHDQACLEEVLDEPTAYIGMIGSKRRIRTVMRHLAEAGRDPAALRRVHAPVGLDIGAQTPAEIAVAVIAEIINVRRGGGGRSLALGGRLGI